MVGMSKVTKVADPIRPQVPKFYYLPMILNSSPAINLDQMLV